MLFPIQFHLGRFVFLEQRLPFFVVFGFAPQVNTHFSRRRIVQIDFFNAVEEGEQLIMVTLADRVNLWSWQRAQPTVSPNHAIPTVSARSAACSTRNSSELTHPRGSSGCCEENRRHFLIKGGVRQ